MSGDKRARGGRASWVRMGVALGIAAFMAQAILVACSEKHGANGEDGFTEGGVLNRPAEPCTEGSVRDCHAVIGEFGGVRSCFAGKQKCTGGVWGACGATDTTTVESVHIPDTDLESAGPTAVSKNGILFGLTTQSLSDASSDGSPCSSNPCDPTCVGFNEQPGDGGINVGDANMTAAWFAPPFTGTVPAGFVGKGMIDCEQQSTPCQSYSSGLYAACQFDSFCNPGTCTAADAASGSCIQYASYQTVPEAGTARTCTLADGGATGVDLTAGIPCTDPNSGFITFTICNRGTSDSPATTMGIDYFGGASSNFPTPPPCVKNATPDCKLPLPKIKAGWCFTVTRDIIQAGGKSLNNCQGIFGSGGNAAGNATVIVNSDQAVSECRLNPSPYTDAGAVGKGCDDNWTDLHKSGGLCVAYGKQYAPRVYQQRYVASCPPDTHPQWSLLSYNVTTPSSGGTSSTVKFEVRSAPIQADGGPGTFTSYVQAALAPSPDPTNCPLSGVDANTCPKKLYTILGGATGGALNEVLDLQVTLTPSVDLQVAPVLNSWQVTYSCPPSQ